MIGAEKWHRGYVQGTARDGGEVQGMTGVEGEYSLGQGILKSKVLLDYARSQAVYTSCHVCLLSISLKSRWVITTNTCHSSFRLPSLLSLVLREITYGVCSPRRVTSPGAPDAPPPV